MTLRTETNTLTVARQVITAARAKLGKNEDGRKRRLQVDFEHGQWWVTDLRTGTQWSVVDCENAQGFYFGFEKVTEGIED